MLIGTPDDSQAMYDWGSRRQGATSRSTTEAELGALIDQLTRSTLPAIGVLEEYLKRRMDYFQSVDNDACRVVCTTGKAAHLAHLRAHRRITVGFVRDAFDPEEHPRRHLDRVDTDLNHSDILTKPMKGDDVFHFHASKLGLVDLQQYRHLFTPHEVFSLNRDALAFVGHFSKPGAVAIIAVVKAFLGMAWQDEAVRNGQYREWAVRLMRRRWKAAARVRHARPAWRAPSLTDLH